MKNKTTSEHYHKYKKMKENLGVIFKEGTAFGSKEHIKQLFLEDPHLNQYPLYMFDSYFYLFRREGGCRSLAECTCLVKHCLIYDVVGAEPEFTD